MIYKALIIQIAFINSNFEYFLGIFRCNVFIAEKILFSHFSLHYR